MRFYQFIKFNYSGFQVICRKDKANEFHLEWLKVQIEIASPDSTFRKHGAMF